MGAGCSPYNAPSPLGTAADGLTETPAPASTSTETDLSGTGSLAATGALSSTVPALESLGNCAPAFPIAAVVLIGFI